MSHHHNIINISICFLYRIYSLILCVGHAVKNERIEGVRKEKKGR